MEIDGLIDRWIDKLKEGARILKYDHNPLPTQMDGWMDGWMNEWMDWWRGGWMYI